MTNIIILTGTPVDAEFGFALLDNNGCNEDNGFRCYRVGLSSTPEVQTKLQTQPQSLLDAAVKQIKSHYCDGEKNILFIYCNSLSGALSLPKLKSFFPQLEIVSPLPVYHDIAKQYRHIALLAANCQSLAHLEKIVCYNRPDVIVTGLSCLDMIKDIEKQQDAERIIQDHQLINQMKIFINKGAEVLVLGCTHFCYIAETLSNMLQQQGIDLPIIELGNMMVEQLQQVIKSNKLASQKIAGHLAGAL